MADDQALVRLLLRGDQSAFEALVERLHPTLVRLCRRFVATDATAEDVAQDTWQAVLQGLHQFDFRGSFDGWVRQIAVNHARTRGARDAQVEATDDVETFDLAGRFHALGFWRSPPQAWPLGSTPESAAENRQLARLAERFLEQLPQQQRTVVTLRDVESMTAEEVCAALGLSEANQRVLLHRGRTRLRALLEQALMGPPTA